MSKRVEVRTLEEGVLLLSLQDAAGKNTFSEAFVGELVQGLREVAADTEARVCLLRGLPEVFCGGAHQALLLKLAEHKMAPADIVLPKLLLDLPIPTIAAMEGHGVGGGLALALCCDMVLMARESRYGCSFMNMGFTPGMGTTRLLQLAVGEYVANEMMYGGQFFKGSHFEQRSAVNHVLPREKVWPRAVQIARRLADKPRHALELLKGYLSLPRRQAFEESHTVEAALHRLCFDRPEAAALIRENYTK